jgi:hypothetical protein
MAKIKSNRGIETHYNPELGQQICDLVAISDDSLDALHARYEWFPHRETILTWRFKNPDFANLYNEAKIYQAERQPENVKDLIKKYMQEYGAIDDKGNKKVDSGAMAACRIEADLIKWQAARLSKMYSDKMQHEHTLNFADALKVLK